MIKQFYCGLCREHERYAMTRLALRLHLDKTHWIRKQKFNEKENIMVKNRSHTPYLTRKRWIIEVEKE